jgi:hypothetical protein
MFEDYMEEELGEAFKEARAIAGDNSRIEKSGTAFTRSLCELARDGHGCCAKGNGKEIKKWFEDNHPERAVVKLSRAEISKRQDGWPEATNKPLPVLDGLTEYLVGTLVQDKNILKDSTLQRLELRQFGAHVHVLAIAWVVAFEELRALTNATVVNPNPMELHRVFDHVWVFAVVLSGADPLSVMALGHRPWPQIRPGNAEVEAWCRRRSVHYERDKARIVAHRGKHDGLEHTAVLKKLLQLMGISIHTSL